MNAFLVVVLVAAALFLIGWTGLRVKPRPFNQPALAQAELKTIPLPTGLPTPVERFYRTVYGEQIPIIKSAVITGRGRMRPFGLWMPARFVMVHRAGYDYRHYFEATFFGVPFLKINEGILNGESFFESPLGTYTNDPNTNQGANLAVWAEAGWFPAVWITDPRTRWQSVDEHTAILFVPYAGSEENIVVRFNPETGLVDLMEAMRFKAKGDAHKVLWLPSETRVEGQPRVSYITWLDDGKPWAALTLEEMQFNLDVSEYIRARGQ
ncbi:MAG TPA: DUF6544 family protein [Anaerolineales bacterium]|nr:DUF6544 family protein [Anaerolineales bacterium]